MAQCQYIKSGGDQCGGVAGRGSSYCWHHAPENREQLRQNAARGGQAKAKRGGALAEVEKIQQELQSVTEQVLAGELGSRPAQVAVAGLNARLRAASEHYRLTEEVEFERRLAELEERTKRA